MSIEAMKSLKDGQELKDESMGLIRYGGFLFGATMAANASNYIFHMIISRLLSPSQYGILNSLLSIFLIISLPVETIKTVITKYVSKLYVHYNYGEIKYFVLRTSRGLFLCGIICFLLIALSSGCINSFLKMPSRAPVITLGSLIPLIFLMPVGYGLLQGLEKFAALSSNILIATLSRLLFGVLFVLAGLGAGGALAGSILQNLVAIGLVLISVRFLLKEERVVKQITKKEVYGYSLPVFLSLLCFAILTNVDMILVKHFFDPVKAGYYSAAALVAKAILLLPSAIIMVMFPKVSRLYALGQKTYPLLKKSLLYSFFLSALAVFACLGFPHLIVRLLFGTKYLVLTPSLLSRFVIAITPFALSLIIINYNLALHRSKLLYPLILGVLSEITFIWFFHSTLSSVIYLLAGNGLLIFLLLSLITYLEERNLPEAMEIE
jgi:O-antigen/teichoic acid export membrane protein